MAKKKRTAAQRAATKRMIAANKRNPAKRRRRSSKRRNPSAAPAAAPVSNPHRRAKRRSSKRRNPSAANPKRHRRSSRRRNPSLPAAAASAGKAVLGGFAAAAVTFGALKLSQKFPAPNKSIAVGIQAAAGIVGGGALGLLGLPAAGTIVASALGGVALQTAMAPAPFASSPPVRGLVRGIAPQQDAPRELVQGGDDYQDASGADPYARQNIRGLVDAINARR